jgi:hypothetical protein
MYDPPAEQVAPPAASPERRAWARYRRRLDMLWQFLGLPADKALPASVLDLSATGVGLLFDHEMAVGALLVVRLPTATEGWASHLVRVKNCRPAEGGQFHVGCAFPKPLRPEQLGALLR